MVAGAERAAWPGVAGGDTGRDAQRLTPNVYSTGIRSPRLQARQMSGESRPRVRCSVQARSTFVSTWAAGV